VGGWLVERNVRKICFVCVQCSIEDDTEPTDNHTILYEKGMLMTAYGQPLFIHKEIR
jgi:hypothetical protein